jgi:hypothetical protein
MNYYLYRHIRLDKNEVFYIGIGTGDRYKSKFSRNKYWKHITSNTNWKSEIIMEDLSRFEAEEKEKEFILLYGRKDLKTGTLCNLTDGGTGGLGLKHTEDSKLKMKGRLAHNKGKSKWSDYEIKIINLINDGLSESNIKSIIGCSNGVIYRIKQNLKKV